MFGLWAVLKRPESLRNQVLQLGYSKGGTKPEELK